MFSQEYVWKWNWQLVEIERETEKELSDLFIELKNDGVNSVEYGG